MSPTTDAAVERTPCPVCHRHVTGSFPNHLQTHSKQDLIYAIINQYNTVGVSPVKPGSHSKRSSHGSGGSHQRARNSTSSASKKTANNERTKHDLHPEELEEPEENKLQGVSLAPEASELRIPLTDLSSTEEPITQPLFLELEIPEYGANEEAESTEVMPIQCCSYISDPGPEHNPDEPNPQFETLYPIDQPDETTVPSTSGSHSDFIQYIIEAPMSGNHGNQQLAEWILPDGRSIPVYSTLAPDAPVGGPVEEDPLSMDAESCHSQATILRSRSTTQQHEFDLMTDEEIPPRGVISEYEESNTSSQQSDELNKPAISIGPTLGSLFTNVRRLPSTVASKKNKKKRKKASATVEETVETKSLELGDTLISVTTIHSTADSQSHSSFVPELVTSDTEANQHKCPEANCSQVGSIFELAQHQERVHQKKYKIKKEKETSSRANSNSRAAALLEDRKPTLTKTGKVKVRVRKVINHTRGSAFQCPYCQFYSVHLKILHGHIKANHPGQPLKPQEHECIICGKIFQKKMNLRKHALIHGGKNYKCDCGKAFTSGFKLMEHSRVHTKYYPFPCSQCDRNFRTPSLLKAHLARTHPVPGTPAPEPRIKPEYFCSLCSRVLRSKRSYAKHIELHTEPSQKCPTCHEVFPKSALLTRHIRIVHDPTYETKESKDCPICSKKLHPNSMKSHMRIHDNSKPFSCSVCNKTFRTSANLTSHSWSHSSAEKPFKCSQCPKSYLFKKCLEVHLIVHKNRRFHFVCNECGMKFTSKVNLKRHSQEHFSEKKYKCSICPKKFHRKYYLVEHERVHSGTKPYHCSVCGKLSTTRSNHRAHVKIHDARESGTQEV